MSRKSSSLVIMRVEVSGFDSFCDLLATDPYFFMILQDVQAEKKIDFLLYDEFLFKCNQLCISDCSLCFADN